MESITNKRYLILLNITCGWCSWWLVLSVGSVTSGKFFLVVSAAGGKHYWWFLLLLPETSIPGGKFFCEK